MMQSKTKAKQKQNNDKRNIPIQKRVKCLQRLRQSVPFSSKIGAAVNCNKPRLWTLLRNDSEDERKVQRHGNKQKPVSSVITKSMLAGF